LAQLIAGKNTAFNKNRDLLRNSTLSYALLRGNTRQYALNTVTTQFSYRFYLARRLSIAAMFALRPYQEKAVELIRESFRTGHKAPLAMARTGASEMLARAVVTELSVNRRLVHWPANLAPAALRSSPAGVFFFPELIEIF
jgi:hypothetical protein